MPRACADRLLVPSNRAAPESISALTSGSSAVGEVIVALAVSNETGADTWVAIASSVLPTASVAAPCQVCAACGRTATVIAFHVELEYDGKAGGSSTALPVMIRSLIVI